MSREFIFSIIIIFILSVALLFYSKTKTVFEIDETIPRISEERLRELKKEAEETEERIVIAAESRLVDNPWQYLPAGKNYARMTTPTVIYASLDAANRGQYFTIQNHDIAWVNIKDSAFIKDKSYYKISWGWGIEGWVSGEVLSFNPILSRLKGVEMKDRLDEHLAMVYVDALNVRSSPGDMSEEAVVGKIGKYGLLSVKDKETVEGVIWYKIDNKQWVYGDYVRNLIPGERPAGVGVDDKWVEVNLSEQTIFAHEGDTPVYATLTSTGRFGRDTIVGLFWPRVKMVSSPMTGIRFDFSYDFSSVPWAYYFAGDYAWHGTYWHDNFGMVQSSGCVNLSPHDAHWFFHWSDPELSLNGREAYSSPGDGTWVHIHY